MILSLQCGLRCSAPSYFPIYLIVNQYCGAPHLESTVIELAINIFGALHLKIHHQNQYTIYLYAAPSID